MELPTPRSVPGPAGAWAESPAARAVWRGASDRVAGRRLGRGPGRQSLRLGLWRLLARRCRTRILVGGLVHGRECTLRTSPFLVRGPPLSRLATRSTFCREGPPPEGGAHGPRRPSQGDPVDAEEC